MSHIEKSLRNEDDLKLESKNESEGQENSCGNVFQSCCLLK